MHHSVHCNVMHYLNKYQERILPLPPVYIKVLGFTYTHKKNAKIKDKIRDL